MHRDEDNHSVQEGALSPVSLALEPSPLELPCILNAMQLCEEPHDEGSLWRSLYQLSTLGPKEEM